MGNNEMPRLRQEQVFFIKSLLPHGGRRFHAVGHWERRMLVWSLESWPWVWGLSYPQQNVDGLGVSFSEKWISSEVFSRRSRGKHHAWRDLKGLYGKMFSEPFSEGGLASQREAFHLINAIKPDLIAQRPSWLCLQSAIIKPIYHHACLS